MTSKDSDHIKRPTAELSLVKAKQPHESCQNRPHNALLPSLPDQDIMIKDRCGMVELSPPLIHNVGKPGIPENPKEVTGPLQPGSCSDQGVKLASLETLELSKK